jgi:hypothetical protein
VLVRLGHALLIVVLLATMGGHWALLQTVAWTNMLAENLRIDSLAGALGRTFDGKHPCKLCRQISAGKKSERKAEFPTLSKKLEFVSSRAAFVFIAPHALHLLPEKNAAFSPLNQPPPLPPPRLLPV